MTNHSVPYENLSPDVILDSIESLNLCCSGNLLALNSYENRVYQVGLEDEVPIIVKFYRPERWTNAAILEEHEFAAELMAREIPVVAPLSFNNTTLHTYQGFRFAIFPRQGGRALELDDMEQLRWMGRFIGRLHAIGSCKSFQHRLYLNEETYGQQPLTFLLENNFIPNELKTNFIAIYNAALAKIKAIFSSIAPIKNIRVHGDCHAGNILSNNSGLHIVDLDDCLMGPAIQDLWLLLSGSNVLESRHQLDCLLDAYTEFHDFNFQEIKLIEALRTLRMINYSAWLAKRWQDPAFPANFPWFNTPAYWQTQLYNMQEQIILLDETLERDLMY